MFRLNLNQNRQGKKSAQDLKETMSCYLYLLNSKIRKVINISRIRFIEFIHKNNRAKKFYEIVDSSLENVGVLRTKILEASRNYIIRIGTFLIRGSKEYKRKLFKLILSIRDELIEKYGPAANKYYQSVDSKSSLIIRKILGYTKRKKDGFIKAMIPVKKAYSNGLKAAIKEFGSVLRNDLRKNPKRWVSVAQFALPIAAIAILFGTISYWSNLNYGLALAYDGQEIATVKDEKVVEQASQMVNQRLVYDSIASSNESLDIVPTYKLVSVSTDKYSSPSAVCDKIIQKSKGAIEEGAGLYIDGELCGVLEDDNKVQEVLDEVLSDEKTNDESAEVKFVEEVETVSGLFPASTMVSSENLKEKLNTPVEDEVYYTIQDGDTPLSIAEQFNMSLDDLNAINGAPVDELIFPNEQLKIKNEKTLLNVSVSKIENYETPIGYQEVEEEDDSQYVGYSNVTQEGEEGILACADKVTYVNGIETSREEFSRNTIKEPIDKKTTVGTKKREIPSGPSYKAPSGDGISTGSLAWPLPGISTISSPFGMRWGSMHSGIDIANGNAYGQTIVAADGGTVTKACDSGDGYGICVIINHGNGMSTLYAHCSSAYVSAGQTVSKGQAIAAVGSTGYSYGAHLHFGVLSGGSYVDPMNYL